VNTEYKAILAAASFHNSSGQFDKTCGGVLSLVSLSLVVSTYWST